MTSITFPYQWYNLSECYQIHQCLLRKSSVNMLQSSCCLSRQCNVSQLRRNYVQLYLVKILLPLIYNFDIIDASELIFEISDNAYLEQRLLLKIISHKSSMLQWRWMRNAWNEIEATLKDEWTRIIISSIITVISLFTSFLAIEVNSKFA